MNSHENVSIVGPDDGEVITIGPTLVRILEDGSTTEHRLGVAEITIAPHTSGPPQHRHTQHDEGFYVVSGTVSFTVGTDTHEARAGTLVMVPPGAPHTFANPTDEPAVMVNTFTPDLYVQYFRDLRDMIAAGRQPTPAAMAEAMRAYATEPVKEPAMTTHHITVDGLDPVAVDVTTYGSGRPLLLLHSGAGPQSVTGFAQRLAATGDLQVLVPVHPGFEATPRPDGLTTIGGLARLYAALLGELGLAGVSVVGNSIGGWIAAEIALLADPRVARVALVDAVGLDLPDTPIADFFSLTMDQVADLSYADPDAFRIDPASLPPARQAVMATNREALRVYGGTTMADPTLLGRLPAATTPVLVVWGAADRIVPPEHGRAYAAALPDARFTLIDDAGHLPQLETPDALLGLVTEFVAVERVQGA